MKTAIDLFCGCGGMAEGLMKAGFHIVFANDISQFASETYINRHTQLGLIEGKDYSFYQGDIHNVTGQFINDRIKKLNCFKDNKICKIDAIFGGPPCQGFSMAGKRDKNDPRNLLFKEYLRVVSEIKPDYVIMENVVGFLSTELSGFVSYDGEKYELGNDSMAPNILINEFKKIGYKTLKPRVLNASDFGVPQNRRRVVFLAYRNGVKKPSYPKPNSNKITLKEAIGDFYINDFHSSYIDDRKANAVNIDSIKNTEKSSVNVLTTERFSLFRDGETSSMIKQRIKKEGIDLSSKPNLLNYVCSCLNLSSNNEAINYYKSKNLSNKDIEILLTKKSMRKKLDPNLPSLTVVTIPDDYINPFNNSIFTVRELARLQSFDDDFIFCGKRTTGGKLRKKETPQYTQVGNAVPPLLAYSIGKSIINVLE